MAVLNQRKQAPQQRDRTAPRPTRAWATGTGGRRDSSAEHGIEPPNADAVSASFDRAVGAGARPVTEPAEHDWGYTALIADPDEHLWTLFAADSVRR
jgi:hypothetical protein